ncbi:hypothetical protein ACIBI7_21625 [Nonomuraea fuscirosea]
MADDCSPSTVREGMTDDLAAGELLEIAAALLPGHSLADARVSR